MNRKSIVIAVLICFFTVTNSAYAYYYGPTHRYGYGGRHHYIYEERGRGLEQALGGLVGGLLIGGLVGYFMGNRGQQDDQQQVVYMTAPPTCSNTNGQVEPQAYYQSSHAPTSPFNGGYVVQNVGYVGEDYYRPPVQQQPQVRNAVMTSYQPRTETPLAQDNKVKVMVADPSWGVVKNQTKKFMQVAIGEEGAYGQAISLAPLQAVRVCLPPTSQSLRVRSFVKTHFGTEEEAYYDGHIQRDAKDTWRLELKEKKYKFEK